MLFIIRDVHKFIESQKGDKENSFGYLFANQYNFQTPNRGEQTKKILAINLFFNVVESIRDIDLEKPLKKRRGIFLLGCADYISPPPKFKLHYNTYVQSISKNNNKPIV